MGNFTFGKVSLTQLDGIDPILKELAIKALEISNVDFGVLPLGGKRSKTQQKKLFDQKVSECDGTIKISYHQSGKAVDLVPFVDGRYTWSNKQAFMDVHVAVMEVWLDMHNKEYDLVWGGSWKDSWDKPHYELRKKK